MADEDQTVPDLKPDVPAESTALVVKDHAEAKALALKMAGEEPPDECRFHCVTCGWNKTLKFEEAEIVALGGDIASYGGPCPGCDSMTLVPYASLMGQEVRTVYEQAKKHRLEEARENADVLVERVKEEITNVMGGSTLEKTPEEQHDPADVHDPRPGGASSEEPGESGTG